MGSPVEGAELDYIFSFEVDVDKIFIWKRLEFPDLVSAQLEGKLFVQRWAVRVGEVAIARLGSLDPQRSDREWRSRGIVLDLECRHE